MKKLINKIFNKKSKKRNKKVKDYTGTYKFDATGCDDKNHLSGYYNSYLNG